MNPTIKSENGTLQIINVTNNNVLAQYSRSELKPVFGEHKKNDIILSIIVPFYNECEVLEVFHSRLTTVLDSLPYLCEIVYVNDGSSDNSLSIVKNLPPTGTNTRCISLSRNFGKESALSAGLAKSRGQAVIILDADLQDPPELIPSMMEQWKLGYDIINMQRRKREGETWFKKFSAKCFYKTLNFLAKIEIPENVGDFRLLDRKVVKHINALPEKNRYMKGIFSLFGFRQYTLLFDRDERFLGETKWNYFTLLGLALDGITSFSIFPLRLASIVGIIITFGTLFHLFLTSANNIMMDMLFFMGGVQFLAIGLLGEYIGRIFIETKQRPLYVIEEISENSPSELYIHKQ